MQQILFEKRKKIIKYMLCALFILIVFLNMNKIIIFFFDDSIKFHKINFDDYKQAGHAYTYLNEFEYNQDDLQEILRCTGWAFAETSENNDQKKIYLIFKGKKNSYITDEAGIGVSMVQVETPGWKNTYGGNHNFGIDVSTLGLPTDIYEIYVYVEENEHAKGIVNTGRGFKKCGVKLYSYSVGEIVGEIDPYQINNSFYKGWIDSLSSTNDCIEVSGWQAIENKNSENTCYYLVFVGSNQKNVTMRIPTIYRTGVGSYLGSPDYIASGFRGALNRERLPDECGDVYVVAENEGVFYRTESYPYDINASN